MQGFRKCDLFVHFYWLVKETERCRTLWLRKRWLTKTTWENLTGMEILNYVMKSGKQRLHFSLVTYTLPPWNINLYWMINDKIYRAQWIDSAWVSSKSFNSIPHSSKVNHSRNPTGKQKQNNLWHGKKQHLIFLNACFGNTQPPKVKPNKSLIFLLPLL